MVSRIPAVCFDVLNRLGMAHECDEETDRQTEWPLAIKSAVPVWQAQPVGPVQ